MDLTKIEKPFGLLDDETQAAMKAHGGPYEVFGGEDWHEGPPSWSNTLAYRVKPKPARKTVYPWDALDDRIKWAAVDEWGDLLISSGEMYHTFYEDGCRTWHNADEDLSCIKFQRGDEPWQDTLQCRPGYEGE